MDEASAAVAYRGDLYAEDPSVEGVVTPLWREFLAPCEWTGLRMSPVYWGWGIPHGNGEPVLLVPGFLESDLALSELWAWLLRIGYQPYFSHIGPNIDCPNATSTDVVENVRRAHRETGKPVTIIGHSLGGMLARSVALNHPEYVTRIISLASPFRDHVRAHPAVLAAIDSIRAWGRGSAATSNIHPTCFSGHCTCDFVKNVLKPQGFAIPRYAIYSRTDGVVDWESCLEEDDRLNIEVNATHIGMVVNAEVYRALAGLLAGNDS